MIIADIQQVVPKIKLWAWQLSQSQENFYGVQWDGLVGERTNFDVAALHFQITLQVLCGLRQISET